MPTPAMLDNASTPTAPPISWNVFTIAERRPPSVGSASASDDVKPVTNAAPIPSAATPSPIKRLTGRDHAWRRSSTGHPRENRRHGRGMPASDHELGRLGFAASCSPPANK
jgi:hypothetical protein